MSTSMLRRQMKNIVHNFSEAEIKVREATSNDPWGPSSSLMSEISDLTYNVVAFSEIMSMVWKRLNDHGKNWRHVYKAMTLLDYLIKTGSDRVTQQCKENIYTLQILKDFQYIDRDGKDQGVNVREKAKQLVTLLKDEERLLEERTNALKTKEKMAQTTNTSSTPSASGLTSSLGTKEEALDMSKKILEQIEKGASDPWRAPAVPSTTLSAPPAIATTPVSASDPWGGNGATTGSPTNSDPWGGEATTSTPPTSSDPWGGEGTVSVQSAKSDPWGGEETTSAPPTSSDPWGGEETTSAPPTSSDPWGGEETTSAQPTSSDPWGGEETTSAPPTSSDPWGGEETTSAIPTSSDPWGGEKTTSVPPISSDPWGGEETTSALPTSSDPWGDASVATPWSSTRQSELCDFKVAETERGDSAEKSLDLSSLGTCLPVRKTPESFFGPNAALVDLGSLVPNTPKQTPLPTTLSQSKEGERK